MARTRDSQRQRVYEWEWACQKEKLIPRHRYGLTLQQAEILVQLCRVRHGKIKYHPDVKHTRSDANKSYYKQNWGRPFIALHPDWGMTEDVIIHETCHSLASCQHHALFVKYKIDLMGFICGADRVEMRRLATKMRVKWRSPITFKSQSQFAVQIASLRRKYRRSFNGEFMSPKWMKGIF